MFSPDSLLKKRYSEDWIITRTGKELNDYNPEKEG